MVELEEVMYINYIYIYRNILSRNIIEKKTSGHVWTRTCVVGLSQQTCYALHQQAFPKQDASSPELSNTVFSHSSNVNSHIITNAIFVRQ